jgi:predicted porin
MPKRTPVAPRLFALRPLALVALCASSGSVFAQASPWNVGVSQGFAHQTNLFGAPSPTAGAPDTRVADKYSVTSLFGGVDLKLSRQRLFANGVVRANRYEDVKTLNNDAYGVNLGLDWETVNNLSGTLRSSANRSLASYTIPGAPVIGQVRNLETSNQQTATVRYGISSRWAATAGWQRREVEYSAAAFRSGEFTQNEVSAGVRYGLPTLLVLGLGVRSSKTDRPRHTEVGGAGTGVFLANESDRRDIDLTADWQASGLSTVNARLSYGKEEHSLPQVPEFKGVTGSIGWNYQPTDKTTLTLQVARDTGTSSAIAPFGSDATPLGSYSTRLTNLVSAGFDYGMTAKIRLNGNLRHAKAKLDGTTGTGSETTRGAGLGASYAFSRAISFNCSVAHEKRETLSADIGNRTVNCAGQLAIR